MKKNIFAKNATTQSKANKFPLNASIPGKLYPPKNSIAIKAEDTNIATYSENKNKPSFMELYSVWYPPMSSDSHSGRSKGALFVSAREQMKNTKKEIG